MTALPQNLSGLNVLVTGGTGVIGAWLLKKLVEFNLNTTVLIWGDYENPELAGNNTLSKTNNIYGSLTDLNFLKSSIKEHEIDVVYHLGAQAIVETAANNPLTTFESNIRGTYNLLEACHSSEQNLKAIVVASSDKAYGAHDRLPYLEEAPLVGRHPYDVSKTCADIIAQSYYETYGLPIGIARCGNIYGGGDLNWSRIVPATIRSFVFEQSPVIRSDGTFVRDYLYVKDAVNGYIQLAENLDRDAVKGQAFNFGNESPVTVLELVSEIQMLMKTQYLNPNVLGTTNSEIHSQYLSAAKARELLGWSPDNDLKSGLMETISWYREFLQAELSE